MRSWRRSVRPPRSSGLFGTVWGIYHALTAIGIAGQASIDKVAGPVGEALIMTAFGLAVAVPAVLGYNWLVRRNKTVMEQVRGFGAELHAVLLSTRRLPQGPDAMAMNVGQADEDEAISTINTTPLVDVMLVLLIIFLITIPVVVTSIPVELPKERNEVRETKPENIVLSVDQAGNIYWNDLRIPIDRRADRPPEEDLGAVAAARSADPRRRPRQLHRCGPDHLCGAARRYREGRLHHRTAAARRLTRRPRTEGDAAWQ